MLGRGLAVGLGVPGAGGPEHAPMRLRGAEHVLGPGAVQEGAGEGVDGPEGLGQVQEEVVGSCFLSKVYKS